jgi:hypothetical protein
MILRRPYEPIRAKKSPLGFILGVFIIAFIFIFGIISQVQGASILDIDFNDYNLGNLTGQQSWTNPAGASYQVVENSECFEGKSISNAGVFSQAQKNGSVGLDQGSQVFYFKMNSEESAKYIYQYLLEYPSANALSYVLIYSDRIVYTLGEGQTTVYYDDIPYEWHLFKIVWDLTINPKVLSYQYEDYDPVWGTPYQNISTVQTVKFASTTTVASYIDYLSETGLGCDEEHCDLCENWYNCQEASCCWYWSPYLQESYCVDCPTGACGTGSLYEMCANCLTEEDCIQIDNCYWASDDICKYGTGQCGEGLECQFCDSQEDCEAHDCYWYDDFCWLSTKPSLFSWADYYDEYGDYETPSGWINDLAENTQKFFEKTGGFLTTFENSFDLREAYQKGADLGKIIPQARGYLAFLDDFVGNLPVGDFFLFTLIFMLAIGVFKAVSKLIQMLKFW